jgi:anaerobic ribonucleoside-triphosphate reductase activating protein
MNQLRTGKATVLFQEVPDHISLAFSVAGCPIKCEGCHSSETWDTSWGNELLDSHFLKLLKRYQGFINCVVFFGGEWHPDALIQKLKIAQQRGLKTCLYTGFDNIPQRIKAHLDFLKTGAYIEKLGGLDSPMTNQVFTDLKTGDALNHRFAPLELAS